MNFLEVSYSKWCCYTDNWVVEKWNNQPENRLGVCGEGSSEQFARWHRKENNGFEGLKVVANCKKKESKSWKLEAAKWGKLIDCNSTYLMMG